jgi:hypothetical protein
MEQEMLDFSKIGIQNSSDTLIPPREIFNALPGKVAAKFQYPRDVQSQVWDKWLSRRQEKSLLLKMNTGSGKTVVGLLILKSSLNEGVRPAVYVCPDKYLVRQVVDAAFELGVDVTEDPKDTSFLSGKSILVINIFKLVNGKSIFGVGDEGVKQEISSLVIDDAHACLDTIEEQFTIRIPSGTDAFKQLFGLFKDSLHRVCPSKAIEIESGEPSSFMQVPYWAWQEKNADVCRFLIENASSDYLKFVWPLIKEDLKLCHCVISSNEIEISPHAIPIHMIPAIQNASRRIFLTTTLVDDSVLKSHFAVEDHAILSPIFPNSAADIGDRMILIPQSINPTTSDVEIRDFCESLANKHNVVVIVPSRFRAESWKPSADLILKSDNLQEGVAKLKAGHVGLTVLINRYDGIDLPGDACRILVIDGFPDVRKKIDRVRQGILMGCERQMTQNMQRIEQGMGRGVRSNDDFCVVLLTGKGLSSQLYCRGAADCLSPGTRAQLNLSEQIAAQVKGMSIGELSPTIDYCLSRNASWISASKGALASLKYPETGDLDSVTSALRSAYDLASNSSLTEAAAKVDGAVKEISEPYERGYLKQVLAEYTNLFDRAAAQKIQKSAISDNRRVFKPLDGVSYFRMKARSKGQGEACSSFLSTRNDPNKLIVEVNGVLDDLQFEVRSANQFEQAMKDLANFIGFEAQRPEQEFGRGPDVLWGIGGLEFLVIECKNEASSDSIAKRYCNQLNGSGIWFKANYGDSVSYTPVMVHPSTRFEHAASPNEAIRIMTSKNLDHFKNSVRDFVASIAAGGDIQNPGDISKKLDAYHLLSSGFIEMFTSPFSQRRS